MFTLFAAQPPPSYNAYFERMFTKQCEMAEEIRSLKEVLLKLEQGEGDGGGARRATASLPEGFTFPLEIKEELDRLNTALEDQSSRNSMVSAISLFFFPGT
jgi:hypothetical protein